MRLKDSLWGLGLGLALAGTSVLAADSVSSSGPPPGPGCQPPPCPAPQAPPWVPQPGAVTPQPGAITPQPGQPLPPEGMAVPTPEAAPTAPTAPETGAFAQAPEAGTAAAASFAPNMLGDTNGGACGTALYEGLIAAMINHPTFGCSRTKIAEDNSPMPQDRVYFDYRMFDNATLLSATETDSGRTVSAQLSVNRYTFGLEKTFFNGLVSAEVRLPLNTQLTNNMEVNSDIPSISTNTTTDIGNLAVALKALLYDGPAVHVSTGLLIQAPTAPDVRVHDVENNFDEDGVRSINNLFLYRNDAVILSPFLGLLANRDRFFLQGFVQFDFDAAGDRVDIFPSINDIPRPEQSFHLREQALLRTDLGVGYWIYRNCNNFLSGIAPTIEAHYTTTLNNAELATFQRAPVGNNIVILGNTANRLDIVNLLLGTTVEFGNRSTVAVGGVIPLSSGDNKPFDWEFIVQLNWRFGARNIY